MRDLYISTASLRNSADLFSTRIATWIANVFIFEEPTGLALAGGGEGVVDGSRHSTRLGGPHGVRARAALEWAQSMCGVWSQGKSMLCHCDFQLIDFVETTIVVL